MSLRSLLTLFLIFVVVSVGLWVAWLNPDTVTFRLPGRTPFEFETRLWVVSFLSLLVGVFVALLYTVVLSSKEAVARWRMRRTERQSTVQTQNLIEGLRAGIRGEKREALALFEGILAEDPENLEAWLEAGHTARHLGNGDKALDLHMRARALSPDDPRIQEALAADLESLGEYGRAVTHVQQLIASVAKPDTRMYAWLRDLLVREGRWDEAEQAQEKRLKLMKDSALRADEETILRGLRFERGQALLGTGKEADGKEAIKIFEGLIKADAQFVPAYLSLGDARLEAGDAEGAVSAWQTGVASTHSLPLVDHLVRHYTSFGTI
jgi:tetratricopeptide (TPR) repeat protein